MKLMLMLGCIFDWDIQKIINPIGAGAQCARTFSRRLSLDEKEGVGRSEISWLFLIHYKLSENPIKIVFAVFWGDIEGVGTLCPRTQATFKRLK